MNAPTLVLAAIVLVPIVVLMVLRINAALVFLSLCLGDVLVQFVAKDTNSFVTAFSNSHVSQTVASSGNNAVKLALLLLPVLLTMIFMFKTVKANRLILNILPAAGVGLLGGLLVVPLLSAGLAHNIVDSSLWHQAVRAQDLIVGLSAVVCLLALWMQRSKMAGDHKHSKHRS